MKNSTIVDRRTIIAFLGAASWRALPAFGQTRNTYAVLSLLGDKLSVVTHLPVVGSNIDRNTKQEISLPDDAFDAAVARAVRDVSRGSGEVDLFSTRDPKLFALQDKLEQGPSGGTPAELVSAAHELLAASKATHFILITKHRADMMVALSDGHVGEGKVSGIGYYIDQDVRVRNWNSGVASAGLFAPFAYLSSTLIDAATLQPISQASAMVSKAYLTGENNHAGVPWDILSPSQKVDALISVIKTAINDTVPKILAGR